MSWKSYKLGELLERKRVKAEIKPDQVYKLVTIRLWHQGVVLREEKSGQDIKSNMYHVNEGDFVLSGIDARNGAFGIVPKELEGAVVTNDFWCLEPKKSLLRKDFFLFLTSTKFFDYICNQCSDGTTQRIRLQKDKFYDFEIALPPVEEQGDLVKSLANSKQSNEYLSTELTHQLDLVKQLRQAFLREAMQGKLTEQWRLKNSPPKEGWISPKVKDGVVHTPSEDYPEGEVVKRNSKNYFSLPYNPALKQRAKELRKAGNLSEVLFWMEVKNKQFKDLDFDRQKIIGNYIVDFYCPNCQVVIEIDGSSHDDKQEYDARRDAYLQELGLKVIHINDLDIKKNLPETMNWLLEHPAFNSPPMEGWFSPEAKDGVVNTFKSSEPVATLSEMRDLPPRPADTQQEKEPPRPADTPPEEGNWEPASVLLEKIKAEKERLVKEKKLKRGKASSQTVSKVNEWSIPSAWVTAKTDDIFFVTKLAGFEYTKHINLKETGEIPVIRAQNVRPFIIDKTNLLFIDEEISLLLDRCALTKESLLVTFIGAGIGDVARFCESERWHLAPNVAKLEPFEGCEAFYNLKYLNYFLSSPDGREEIFKHVKATAQPSLSMGTIRDIDVPLPPLSEQQRIVAKLDELMGYCDALDASIKESQQQIELLLQQVLREALEPSYADASDGRPKEKEVVG